MNKRTSVPNAKARQKAKGTGVNRPSRRAKADNRRQEALARLQAAAKVIRPRLRQLEVWKTATVKQDIAYCRVEAKVGEWYDGVCMDCKILGIKPQIWLQQNGFGDATKFKDRLRLSRNWPTYLRERRAAGPTAFHGMEYALLLIRQAKNRENREAPSSPYSRKTGDVRLDPTRRQFIVGDTLEMLKREPDKFYQCVVASPPYPGSMRDYDNAQQIGFEPTLDEYLDRLTAIFNEIWRILRDDGICWVVIGDLHGRRAGTWLKTSGASRKATVPVGQKFPALGKPKSVLRIPSKLADRLEASGWIIRHILPLEKTAVRPEPIKDRPATNHEFVLMLTKHERYYSNFGAVASEAVWTKARPGSLPRDGQPSHQSIRDLLRDWGKGEKRNLPSVWRGPAQRYFGKHPATFAPWIPALCIAASCSSEKECHVLDPFCGAGTTVIVAAQLGHWAKGIDLNPDYVREAEERYAKSPPAFVLPDELGTPPHHKRLQNAACKALTWEDRFNRLAADPSSLSTIRQEIEAEEFGSVAPVIPVSTIRHERIRNADVYFCNGLSLMQQLEPASIPLIMADLPYGMTNAPWDTPLNLKQYFRLALRLLAPRGVILMFATTPFVHDVAQACRELLRGQWNWWDDGPLDGHQHVESHPLKLAQHVLVFSASGREFTFNPQKLPLAKPERRLLPMVTSRLHKSSPKLRRLGPQQYEYAHPTDALFFPTNEDDRLIPTQKPLSFAEYWVRTYSNPGDRIADFTFGSCTFGLAALKLGRLFVGSESDPKHFQIAVDRLHRAFPDSAASDLAAE